MMQKKTEMALMERVRNDVEVSDNQQKNIYVCICMNYS
jgi:hypothetical protein